MRCSRITLLSSISDIKDSGLLVPETEWTRFGLNTVARFLASILFLVWLAIRFKWSIRYPRTFKESSSNELREDFNLHKKKMHVLSFNNLARSFAIKHITFWLASRYSFHSRNRIDNPWHPWRSVGLEVLGKRAWARMPQEIHLWSCRESYSYHDPLPIWIRKRGLNC